MTPPLNKPRGPKRTKPLKGPSDYSPNFKDPRVIKRIQAALEFAADNLSEDLDLPIPKSKLEQAFGPVGNKLGDWLRANLLIRSSQYIPGVQFYKYRLRKDSLSKVAAKVTSVAPILFVNTSSDEAIVARRKKQFTDQINTFTFEYELKSDRYWHPLQNLKRSQKEIFWRDLLPYNYDINAAAPTLLIQTAKRAGLLNLLAGPIDDYVANRSQWRQHVSNLTNLSLDDAKRLLNSLFNGARLSKTTHCAAYRTLLEHMSAAEANSAMERLQHDKQLRLLRLSIKHAWQALSKRLNTSLKTSKNKWSLYFKLERRVLDAMVLYLNQTGNEHFTEHDGFRSRSPVDVSSMQTFVKNQTGYEIEINSTSAAP